MTISGGASVRRESRVKPFKWEVGDAVWERVGPRLEDPMRRFRYPGRPRKYSPRACLEGILYVLYTDTPWSELPYEALGLPSGETCRRRLEEWEQRGVFQQVLEVLQEELAAQERLDWSRVIAD